MSEFISRCHDTECECYGKALVWIPVYGESEPIKRRLVCPSEILTQSGYNLKFVKYESKAQMEEEDE